VFAALGKLDSAHIVYREGNLIVKALVDRDPSNKRWQGDLSVSYEKIGDVLVAWGKLDVALVAYRESLTIRKAQAEWDQNNTQLRNNLQSVIARISDTIHRLVVGRDFATALEAADQAIALAPKEIRFCTSRAHALMFLGRLEEARAFYLQYRGTKNAQDEEPWDAVVLKDFVELRKAGLAHPLMDEIEALFAGRG